MNVYERFWIKVQKSAEADGCWVWTAGKNRGGYGLFLRGPRDRQVAHRVSWEWENGAVPDGLELDHLCRNTSCVRPSHLEPVTRSENHRRGANGYRLTGRCRSGRHEIRDERDMYVSPAGNRTCAKCKAERRQLRAACPKCSKQLMARHVRRHIEEVHS